MARSKYIGEFEQMVRRRWRCWRTDGILLRPRTEGNRIRLGAYSGRRKYRLDGLDRAEEALVGLRDHRQQKGWRRFGVLLLSFLQLAAVGFVPTADALLEQAAADDPVHVEPLGTDSCDVSHDHVYCQLCRVLGLTGATTPDGGAVAPCAPQQVAGADRYIPSSTPASHLLGGPGSRAPPVA